MERNNERQSSLPSSLIPHLYLAPHQPRDSSTRTTLETDDQTHPSSHRQQHPVSPVLFPFVPPSRQYQQRRSSHSLLAHESDPLGSGPSAGGSASLPDLNTFTSTMAQQRFGDPIYDDPQSFHTSSRPIMSSRVPSYTFPPPLPPREYGSQRMAWREGEAGPSSLMHSELRGGQLRRGSSLSPRVAPQPDAFGRGNTNFEHDPSFGDVVRRDAERAPYFSLTGHSAQQQQPMHPYFAHSANSFQEVLQSPQLVLPESDEAFTFRHDNYTYPAVGNLTLSTPSPNQFRSSSSADSAFIYRPDSRGGEPTSQDEFDVGTRYNKRGRADSVDAPDSLESRKQRNPRKTAVACNFCRGRKLRCNGARPTCSHCAARKIKCEYVSTPRRRGPGKAPRGSRPKKATASRLDPSSSRANIGIDRLPIPEYELDVLAPEVRPYASVMALGSLDTFGFQPPPPAPRYPYPGPDMMREYYTRARTPRSRETSSEDRSDAERNEWKDDVATDQCSGQSQT